ncbi:MAG: hypothetical protein LC109_02970 [Bacteroidia bacterium]|nr:hypothetical protein [Bacteroidia bacterium]
MGTVIEKSNKWRNVIVIKHLFQDKTTPELIIQLCDSILIQLKKIQEQEAKSNLTETEKWNIDSRIEDILGNFQFLKDFATGDIPQSEWEDYNFNGDYQEMFNGYLSELYDLGDERVMTTKNTLEKFLWVG